MSLNNTFNPTDPAPQNMDLESPSNRSQEDPAITFSQIQLDHFRTIYRTSLKLRLMYFFFIFFLLCKGIIFVIDILSIYAYFSLDSFKDYKWAKYVYSGSVGLDLLLTVWEAIRARQVHKTGDISYIFTNSMALTYNMLTSKARFALYKQLTESRTRLDKVALFLYHQLRNWKMFLLVLTPRRLVNILFLIDYFVSGQRVSSFSTLVGNLSLSFSFFHSFVYSIHAIAMTIAVVGFIWVNLTLLRKSSTSTVLNSEIYLDGEYEEDDASSSNLKAFCITLMDKRLVKILRDWGYRVPSSRLNQDSNNISPSLVLSESLPASTGYTPKFSHPRRISFRRPSNKRDSVMSID